MKNMIYAVILAQLCFALAKAECPTLQNPIENACDYVNDLKLTTSDKTVLDKNNCGISQEKNKWKDQPNVNFHSAYPFKTYTIVMVDPDENNYEDGEYYVHWIVSNIPGMELGDGNISKGKKFIPYEAPNPQQNDQPHRYMLLIFEEHDENQKIEHTPTNRDKFRLIPWLQSQTKHLCGPVAGIQFKI